MLIDFVEISRGLGSDTDLSGLRILGLMLLKSPAVILQLLPFVFLFGTLAAFVSLNRRSELIAMRAAGVSAWRFVLPAAGAALVLGVLTVAVLGPRRRLGRRPVPARARAHLRLGARRRGAARRSGCARAKARARWSSAPVARTAPTPACWT